MESVRFVKGRYPLWHSHVGPVNELIHSLFKDLQADTWSGISEHESWKNLNKVDVINQNKLQ